MPAHKCSLGLPLKFQDGTFGAIQIFRKIFFTESFTGCELEISMSGNFKFSMVELIIFTKLMDALVSIYTNLGKKMSKNDATIT